MKLLEQEINRLNNLYLGEKRSICVYDMSTGEVEHKSIETGRLKKTPSMNIQFDTCDHHKINKP